ncbi:BhlA/UviB family holin-like peptide [Desulfolucanica intricata]|uniref:BhlA/UviB family holin-like peptide n=1 Tax=Desulfolucanica intricata TaxID=1285191 RepID=UPI000832C904|nr:BhlA/UviB family holin-like peptide [Desulfolucanica intricata]
MDNLSPDIVKMIISQGIFAVLFVWLLYDSRREAKIREEKLMSQIEKSEEQHAQIIKAIEILNNKIN